MLNLDFSSVPSREPLEEGIYNVVISKAEEKESSAKNPMIVLEYDVQGVEGNRKLWDNYPIMTKTLWKLKELFDAIGIPTDSIVDMDVAELVGQSLKVKVIQEIYNGDVTNRVKKVYPC